MIRPGTKRAALLLVWMPLLACGGNGTSNPPDQDSTPPADIANPDIPDTIAPDVPDDGSSEVFVPGDQPMYVLVTPPSLCGCDPAQIPPKNCGWYVKDGTIIRVRAGHTAGKYVGDKGIYRVRLMFFGDLTQPQGVMVSEAKVADETGHFALEVDTKYFVDPATGNVKDGAYPFQIVALSKTKGEDDQPMQKSVPLAITVDTTGPSLQLVLPEPKPGQSLRFIESLLTQFKAQDTLAGLTEVHFFLGTQEVNPPVTGLNGDKDEQTLTRTLDISALPSQQNNFRVVAMDCIGNQSESTLPVQIVAVPRFEMPAHPRIDDELTGAINLHLADMDAQDGLDDLLVVFPGKIAVARTSLDGSVQPMNVLAEVAGLKDAILLDVTQDGFADLVTLTTDGDVDTLTVLEQKVNDGDGTWTFPDPPAFQATLGGPVTLLKTRDMNVDGAPDLVLGGPLDSYSVAVFLHTRKGPEFSDPKQYFGSPSLLTGVTNITSIEFGYLDSDGYPDLVLGRGAESTMSVIINDRFGSYGIAHDTVLHGGGTKLSAVGDFNEDGVDDILVTGLKMGGIYLVTGTGTGYFAPLAPGPGETDVAFGLAHVTNQVTAGMFNDTIRSLGDILFVGSEPDSMVLANLDEFAERDLAVAIPEANRIAIYRYEPGSKGQFGEHYSANPGLRPRFLVTGKFNQDQYFDLACIVGDGTLAVMHNRGAFGPGTFTAPTEIPMPVQPDWTQGRMAPTHFLAANIDNLDGTDLVVLTEGVDQSLDGDDVKTQLVLSWLSDGGLPLAPAYKSPMNPDLGNVTGLAGGKLDSADNCMDLVMTLDEEGSNACESRSLEVMRGCRRVAGAYNSEDEKQGANADFFYSQQAVIPGRFWSLGGYMTLRRPKGLAVARLDNNVIEDVVVFASREGEIEDPLEYQPNIVATYLTRYDGQWLSVVGVNTCPQTFDQIWFPCAPYWPPQQTSSFYCDGSGEPPKCSPVGANLGACAPWEGPAKSSDQTVPTEVGIDPVAAIVGDFYPDGEGCNDILVAWDSGSMSYLKGSCGPNAYKFHSDGLPPNLYAIGAHPLDLQATDIDEDGSIDVVAALAENISIMYGRDFGANFDPPVFLVSASAEKLQPTAVVVADVNGDGTNDIVVPSKKLNQLAIYVGAGGRQFLGPYFLPAGAEPIDLVIADMDNDGCSDLAVLNAGSSTVTMLRSLRCD